MIKKISNIYQVSFRFFATKVSTKKPRSNAEKIRQSSEVLGQQTQEHKLEILGKFPNKLLRKKQKTPDTFYMVNESSAHIISEHFTKDLPNSCQIVEVNPGPGLLTQKLLGKDEIKKLLLFEIADEFMPYLNELHSLYPERIKVKHGDFINMWKLIFRDKQDNGTRLHDLLIDLPTIDYTEEISTRIYCGIGTQVFFKHLINSLIFQTSILSMCRPEFFVVMPPPLYIHLTATNKIGYLIYRATSILFQIMFEHKFITKLPRESFLPWQHEYNFIKSGKLSKLVSIDPEFLYLVKIKPRRNVYDLIAQADMSAFWYFVKQNCISRKNRVIPNLEKWVPGCGPRLIVNLKKTVPVTCLYPDEEVNNLPKYSSRSTTMSNQDHFDSMSIFTEFGDLSPSQMLTLFSEFRSWPEYAESPFLVSLENNLLKMEQSSEDVEDGLTINEVDDDPATAQEVNEDNKY